jgi:general secretion pathway protein B
MSIILNALKKSEAERRLGKAPTLADTAAITNVEEKSSHSRWPWIVLLLLLLLAAGWYGREYLPFPVAEKPIAANQPGTVASPQSSAPATETVRNKIEPALEKPANAGSNIDINQPSQTVDAARLKAIQERAREAREKFYKSGEATLSTDNNASNSKNFSTPVESYSAPASSAPVASSPPGGTSSAKVENTLTPGTRSTSGLSPEPVVRPVAVGTEPLTIYEVPREIRRDLPEFRITLQVFADEPENRFALVNGIRLLEGNELSSGLVLIEIRNRGLVFSYRDYRFIVGN